MIFLTPEERERFAAWLEADAATDADLLKQMERLPGIASSLSAQRKRDIAAKLRVAALLRLTQTVVLPAARNPGGGGG